MMAIESLPRPVSASKRCMSFKRQDRLLTRNSLSPVRYIRRVMATSAISISNCWSLLSNTSVTSAALIGLRFSVPEKIISSAFCPRKLRTLDSPKTHFIASVILLLPLPLGPITAVIPGENFTIVLSANDLKPFNSNRSNCMTASFLLTTLNNHIFYYNTYCRPSIQQRTVFLVLSSHQLILYCGYSSAKYNTFLFLSPLTLDVKLLG